MPTVGITAKPVGAETKPASSIARQPILDVDQHVFAYRLLFQPDSSSNISAEGPIGAAIDTALVLGLDVLSAGYPALIDFTRPMLMQEYARLLPPDQVVVELDASVPPDALVVAACQLLQAEKYPIALGNFAPGDPRQPLVPYARFLIVDLRKVPLKDGAELAKRYGAKNLSLIAEGVETRQQFWAARTFGFTHFLGYFFHEPETLRARQIPANKAVYLRLLQSISRPKVDLAEIEKLIKQEASLCYRLLRYLNSPAFPVASPVQSVHHALAMLGERETIRWIRMATTVVIGDGRPSDLVLASLVRARFCELIAAKVPHGDSDLFLLGMLSLMDAILDIPMGVLMDGIAVDSATRAQLLAAKMGKETPLSPIYNLMVAREKGEWEKVTAAGKQLKLSLVFIAESYNEAVRWAHGVTSALAPAAVTPAKQ